jgi:hypothetical protein
MDKPSVTPWKEAFIRAVASTAVAVLAASIAIPSLIYVFTYPGLKQELQTEITTAADKREKLKTNSLIFEQASTRFTSAAKPRALMLAQLRSNEGFLLNDENRKTTYIGANRAGSESLRELEELSTYSSANTVFSPEFLTTQRAMLQAEIDAWETVKRYAAHKLNHIQEENFRSELNERLLSAGKAAINHYAATNEAGQTYAQQEEELQRTANNMREKLKTKGRLYFVAWLGLIVSVAMAVWLLVFLFSSKAIGTERSRPSFE